MQVRDFCVYSIKPAMRPAAARTVAALLSILTPSAPLLFGAPVLLEAPVPVAAGALVDNAEVTKPEVTGVMAGPLPPVVGLAGGGAAAELALGGAPLDAPPAGAEEADFALAWKASKDLSAVGLIAKTIPALQWSAGTV